MGGDSLRELAAVEVVGALGCDLLQGVRQLWHGEPLALDERAARPVERVSLGRIPQERVENAVQKRLHLVEDDTLARELRRGSEQLRPRHGAPAAMSLPEPEDGAGHRDGHRAGVEGLLRVAVVDDDSDEILRPSRSLGDGDEEVEEPRARLPPGVDEEEAAAARTGERALADP